MDNERKPDVMPGLVNMPRESMRVGVQDSTIIIEFSKSITHAYLSPGEALFFIQHLLQAVIKITSEPPRIIKPN